MRWGTCPPRHRNRPIPFGPERGWAVRTGPRRRSTREGCLTSETHLASGDGGIFFLSWYWLSCGSTRHSAAGTAHFAWDDSCVGTYWFWPQLSRKNAESEETIGA